MCLIGLLLPFMQEKETERHKRRSSSHRHPERRHRERSRRREERMRRDSAVLAEDALARLCLSLEHSLLEERERWQEQARLDMSERCRLGLERDRPPFEAAPPYSPPSTVPDTKPEPAHPGAQGDSSHPPRGKDPTGNSTGTTSCRRRSVCARCGSAIAERPAVPELDDTAIRTSTDGGADSRKRLSRPNGGPHTL
ncbi:hypothetical protein VTH06DRAFT_556 [Thermothelomyces fergusii]